MLTRELSTGKIERLVNDFRLAARILRMAEIDAIQLHAHQGYLFDQFQTALWNPRADKYGGTLEARLTFALEVIEAVKRGSGDAIPIIYRFGLQHYLKEGRELEEGLEIARRLERAGVDALEVDAGCYETWYWPHPTAYQPPGCMVEMEARVKKTVNIPVASVGNLGHPELAESVLKEGKADFITLGKALLADPEWPNKVRENRWEDIRPCLGDNEGCLRRVGERKYISCTVNPATGMEREFALKPAKRGKSILVVGGGPGGMEAARVAAMKGHKVTLWGKGHVLGGNLVAASVPSFKRDYRRFIEYLSTISPRRSESLE